MVSNVLYIDGGARPSNPGPAGFACVLEIPNGQVRTMARYIGWHSNNVAEYHGLVVGIKLAIEYIGFSRKLTIFTDSKVVWGHMTQGWRRNNEALKLLAQEAEKLLSKHYEDKDTGEYFWELNYVPRSANAIADELCTKAILQHKLDNPNPFSMLAGVK